MTFFELFLIGIGLSMDAFAVSICKGLSMQKIDKKYTLCIGLFFGGFPAIVHDGLQRGGTGLGFGQHRVEVFQLHTVALQGIQV